MATAVPGAGGSDVTGFFKFDTNINAVVSEVLQGVQRLHQAASQQSGKPVDMNAVVRDVGALGSVSANVKSHVDAMNRSLREMVQQVGQGFMSPAAFQKRAYGEVRSTMLSAQQSLLSAMPTMNSATLRELDFRPMFRGWLQDIFQNAQNTIQTFNGPEAGGLLKDLNWRNVQPLYREIGNQPFGGQTSDYYTDLWRRNYAEGMLRQAAKTSEAWDEMNDRAARLGLMGGPGDAGVIATRMPDGSPVWSPNRPWGIYEQMRATPALGGLTITNGNNVVQGVVPTNTAKDLAEEEKRRRTSLAMGDKEIDQVNRLADAEEKLEQKRTASWEERLRRFNMAQQAQAGAFGPEVGKNTYIERSTGRAIGPAPGGLDYLDPVQTKNVYENVDKAAKAQAKLSDETLQYQQLLKGMADGSVTRLGFSDNYIDNRLPQARELYKLTGDTTARRIGGELQVQKALDMQAATVERMLRAEGALAQTRSNNALREAQRNSGMLGGFMARFHRGDTSVLTGLGTQVASAAAFSMAYGSIFALQAAVRDTINEFVDYQDSVTDLEVAMGSADRVTGTWINSLGELARLSGSNVGAALDAAARGIRAFTDPMKTAQEEAEAVGNTVAEASTKLALIAGKEMRDATGDLIATSSGYGLEADQLNNVVEAVAQAKRNLGGDPNQISQGLAMLAGAAAEAGFELQETADIISLVQARTDQSGQAIATRLARVFQIMSGSTGKGLAAEMDGMMGVSVDADSSVRDQLVAYAQIYSSTESEFVKDRITSALGGTANLKEILPLLKEGSRLAQSYKRALNDAGIGTDEFNRKTTNLVGEMKKIAGSISLIQTDLSRANLFAPFALLVKTMEPALHGLNQIIKAYDTLTGKSELLQSAIGFGVTGLVAAKGISMVQSKRGLFNAVDTGAELSDDILAAIAARTGATQQEVAAIHTQARARMGVETAMNAEIAAAGKARLAAEAVATRAAMAGGALQAADGIPWKGWEIGGAGAAGGLASKFKTGPGTFMGGMGTLLRFIFNPVTALVGVAVGGLVALGKWKDTQDAVAANLRDSNARPSYKRATDGSAENLQELAEELNQAAGRIKHSDVGWFAGEETQKDLAKLTQVRSRQMQAIARGVELEAQRAARLNDTQGAFGGAIETVSQLADGLDAVAEAGGTALQQLEMMRKAMDFQPQPGKEVFQPNRVAAQIQTSLFDELAKAIPKDGITSTTQMAPQGYPFSSSSTRRSQGYPFSGTGEATPQDFESQISKASALNQLHADNMEKEVNKIIQQGIRALGMYGQVTIDREDKARLLEYLTARMDFSALADQQQEIVGEAVDAVVANLTINGMAGGAVPANLLNGKGDLTDKQLNNYLNGVELGDKKFIGFVKAMEAAMSMVPMNDDNGDLREATITANIEHLKGLRDHRGGKGHMYLEYLIANLETELAKSQMERLDDLREAAESRAKTNKELRAVRLKWAKKEALAVVDQPEILESLFEMLDQETVDALVVYLKAAHVTKLAAVEHARGLLRAARTMLKAASSPEEYAGILEQVAALESDLAKAVEDADRVASGLEDMPSTLDESIIPDKRANLDKDGGSSSSKAKDEHTAWQHRAMQAQALVDPDDTIGAAQAALEVARANEAAAKTIDDKIAATAEVKQAQDALDKAYASYAGAMAAVQGAKTNSPIDQAAGAIQAASAQLQSTAAGTEGYAQALASWYQAQWQMREAVLSYQASLDQLSGDMTDPVEQARDAAADAQRRLDSAIANGAGKDVIASLQVADKQSDIALEKAKWDQRLSDMRVAEQLGNISQAQYTRYLENESARMHAMHNKTRQQIDYMNQIDLELKNAKDAMDGMWNVGDINTRGLVYQMRRFKEERQQERRAQQAANTAARMSDFALMTQQGGQQVSIYIDGADVAKVRKVIEDYLGAGRVRTSQSRRR